MYSWSHLVVLNIGEPTQIQGGRLDFTMASPELSNIAEWYVDTTSLTDHYRIYTCISVRKTTFRRSASPDWNYKKANWPLFNEILLLRKECSTDITQHVHVCT